MKIANRETKGFRILDILENTTSHNVRELEKCLDDLANYRDLHLVVHFCPQVESICSGTISALVRTWKKLMHANGSVRIIADNFHVVGYLRSCDINRIIPIYDSQKSFENDVYEDDTPTVRWNVRDRVSFKIVDVDKPVTILSGHKELDSQLYALITQGNRFIALNLVQLGNVYSELAGLINQWGRYLKNCHGILALVGLRADLKHGLSVLGFDDIVTYCDLEEELDQIPVERKRTSRIIWRPAAPRPDL